MNARRQGLVLLLLSLLVMGGLAARTDRAWQQWARYGPAPQALLDALAAAPDCAPVEARPVDVMAVLLQDLDDPNCADDRRLPTLLAEAEPARVERTLRGLLRLDRGPARLRMRVARALLRREQGLSDAVRAELASPDHGPAGRAALMREAIALLGPEPLTLVDPLPPDANGVLAAARFAAGDEAEREALTALLRLEASRPARAPADGRTGLEGQREALVSAALEGLGLPRDHLAALQGRLDHGLPLADQPVAVVAVLRAREERCEALTSDSCLELVLALLDATASADDEGDDGGDEGLDDDDRDAAAALREAGRRLAGDQAGRRVLGAVAAEDHLYGPGPWWAGQRGEPWDALRYGRASPGATAVAALTLARHADAELWLGHVGDVLVLRADGREARVGPCGESPSLPQDAVVQPLDDHEVVALARADKAAGWLLRGRPDLALASMPEDLPTLPELDPLRAALLACQGIPTPGAVEADAAVALAWARFCGQQALVDHLLVEQPEAEQHLARLVARRDTQRGEGPLGAACGAPWKVLPPLIPP